MNTIVNPTQTPEVEEARVPMRRARTRRAPAAVAPPEAPRQTQLFEMRPTGLLLKGSPTLEECIEYGTHLGHVDNAAKWTMGDLLLYMESRPDFGEQWSQALNQMQKSEDSLQTFMNVARKFPQEKRRPLLSFSHHREVAAMEEHERDVWLDRAEGQQLSSKQLRELVKSTKPKPALKSATPLLDAAPAMAGIVFFEDGEVEIWTGDQVPEAERRVALLHRQGYKASFRLVVVNSPAIEIDLEQDTTVESPHDSAALTASPA